MRDDNDPSRVFYVSLESWRSYDQSTSSTIEIHTKHFERRSSTLSVSRASLLTRAWICFNHSNRDAMPHKDNV